MEVWNSGSGGVFQKKKMRKGEEEEGIATTLQQSDSINTRLLRDLVTCWCLTLRLPPPIVWERCRVLVSVSRESKTNGMPSSPRNLPIASIVSLFQTGSFLAIWFRVLRRLSLTDVRAKMCSPGCRGFQNPIVFKPLCLLRWK